MTKTIAKPELESLERKAPVIDPARITLNADGFAWRDFMVRVPDGFIADDLKEPGVWVKVQQNRNALRKLDRVLIVAFDESWIAECRVEQADGKSAVLAKPTITSFKARYESYLETDKYRVAWCGHGFLVEEKASGRRMTQPVATPELAARDLSNLYPRAVS